jgi:CheY-like chemotaxis protein
MLAYSGRSRFVLAPIDLPRLSAETRHLIEAVISKNARVEIDLEPVPLVEGDKAQIRQVIMNLITNASDALKGYSGTVRVATREIEISRDVLGSYQLGDTIEPGRYVCLEVTDSGAGMDEDVAARIFDPFFTTKFTGRGLGLSAVLGIVRAHHGAIRVESKPGLGTTIRLLLPPSRVPSDDRQIGLEGLRVGPAWRGSGTVLIADDEPPVLRVLSRTLERAGFDVVTATNGREALERFTERGGDFVAVILDMTMPEQGGRETLVALRRAGADVPIILSSGYSADEASAEFEGDQPDGFIQKPYATSALLATLESLIEGRG